MIGRSRTTKTQLIESVMRKPNLRPSLVNVERLASQISENRLALQSIHRRLNEEYRQQQTNVEGEEESTERQNIMVPKRNP